MYVEHFSKFRLKYTQTMCKNPAYRFILKITNNTMKKLKQKAPAANAIATMNADETDGDCSVRKKKRFLKIY